MSKLTCYNCKNYMEPPQCYITLCPIDPVTSVEGCPNFKPIDCLKTVFDHITASPEVLAPCFVEKQPDKWDDDDYPYYSYLTKEWYATEDKAITATVAKLKEVAE